MAVLLSDDVNYYCLALPKCHISSKYYDTVILLLKKNSGKQIGLLKYESVVSVILGTIFFWLLEFNVYLGLIEKLKTALKSSFQKFCIMPVMKLDHFCCLILRLSFIVKFFFLFCFVLFCFGYYLLFLPRLKFFIILTLRQSSRLILANFLTCIF